MPLSAMLVWRCSDCGWSGELPTMAWDMYRPKKPTFRCPNCGAQEEHT